MFFSANIMHEKCEFHPIMSRRAISGGISGKNNYNRDRIIIHILRHINMGKIPLFAVMENRIYKYS